MTADHYFSQSEPKLVEVRAIDVRPYQWDEWCTIGSNPVPFANTIVSRRWSEDGESIWFMLESHNFFNAKPDDILTLIPRTTPFYESEELRARIAEDDERKMATRPARQSS